MGDEVNTRPQDNPPVGWRCPVCGRGNSPWNATCPCTVTPPPYMPAPYPPPAMPWYPTYPTITCCGGKA